jgi:hypothetical protein
MASKKKMAKKGNFKVPISHPNGLSQEENAAIEPSPKVNTSVDLKTESIARKSALKPTIKVGS